MKTRLESISEAKEIPFANVLLLLINKLLQRKPDIFDVFDRPIDLIGIEQKLVIQQMKVISAYNLMRLEIAPKSQKIDRKCQIFLAESDEFIRQLTEKI